MEENKMSPPQTNPSMPEQTAPTPPVPPPSYIRPEPPRYAFPFGKKELVFGILVILFSMLLCNSLIYAGLNLGFAAGATGILLSTAGYLRSHGHKPDLYTGTLLSLSLVILAAFPRSSDNGMKVLMTGTLLVVPSLAHCLISGQNVYSPAGITSLLDAPRATFALGTGRLPETCRGLRNASRSAGSAGKAGGAVALGLLIAVPVLVILVPLLMSADAAFEGLLDQMPEFRLDEAFVTLFCGTCAGFLYYARGAALHHTPKSTRTARVHKGLNAITVNTVLLMVALVYGVYLFSQLAYFVGGFSGLLPEEYTMAQYARRGFFEMGWLCAINLGLIGLSVGLVGLQKKAPLMTKLLCLFLGFITLFLVAAASAKMLLYIDSYGLTRLRVFTEMFMIWLALTTVFVCFWLFRPKLPYMKLSMVLALVLCAGLMWADVDAQVAKYNVRAYQSGTLDTVDVAHLSELSDSAVPYLYELTRDSDPEIAQKATAVLRRWDKESGTLRSWNYSAARAKKILEQFCAEDICRILDLNLIPETTEVLKNTYRVYSSYGEYAVMMTLTPEQAAEAAAQIQSKEAFKQLPLPLTLEALLYDHDGDMPTHYRGPYFTDSEDKLIAPAIKNGYYFFLNRHPTSADSDSTQNLHFRDYMAFTLALYDSDTNTLYFFMKDS